MENNYNCIYMYINKINERKYVGQAKDFNKRHMTHMKESSNKYPIDRALKKHGEENFEIKILIENVESTEKLNEYEKFFIKRYKTLATEWGYNISNGGESGHNNFAGKTEEEMKEIFNDEWREKVSNRVKEYWKNLDNDKKESIKKKIGTSNKGKKISDETRKKLSDINKGENNNMYGKKHSEESKQKMSQSQKGKKRNDDFKEKISKVTKGKNNPRSKRVAQYDLNGNLIKIWDYAKQVSQELNINYITLNDYLNNRRKTNEYKGYVWKYYEED